MKIDTTYIERCIATLDKAFTLLQQANPENIDYDMYSPTTGARLQPGCVVGANECRLN